MKLAIEDYPGFHERMSRLRDMEIGLDGAICTDDGEVKVHLPYIAACNQTLFNRITGLIKQRKTELKARNMSLRGIQLMIDYCYTGELEITEDNFEHMIDAALGLEFLNVVEQCVQFAMEPTINANIWGHFLRAAFKHLRSVQPDTFVPDLILHNITKIPQEALIKGLNAAYIREILEHGSFDDNQRSYTANAFLEIMLTDKSDIINYRDAIIGLRDKLKLRDKVAIPPDVTVTTIMALLELALGIGFTAVVEACVVALEKSPPTAEMTSQTLKWMKQYQGSGSETHLNKLCYHAYMHLLLDIDEDDLCVMLDSDCLGQSKEIDIFKIAFKWIEHNKPNVQTNVKIISSIRFGLMTKDELDVIAKECLIEGCEKILFNPWRSHLLPYEQPFAEGKMYRIRVDHPLIYILGGKDASDNYNQRVIMSEGLLKQGTVSLSPFTHLCQTPFALSESSCAEVNGFVFVSGGTCDSKEVDSFFRFDPRTSTWMELEKMGQKRCTHTLTAMCDVIIAVGGKYEGHALTVVERYDVRNNTWSVIDPRPERRSHHAASCVDGVLYISGGKHTKSLFSFCDHVWNTKSSMLQVRQCHAMAGVSGMLIVAGGSSLWSDLMSAECYDVIQDQWTEQAFSSRINNWLYIFGGFAGTESARLDVIQRYNIEGNEWEICDTKLPQKMSELAGACISNSR